MNDGELVELIAEKVMRLLSERGKGRSGKKRLLIMTGKNGAVSAETAWRLKDEYECTWQDRREAYAQELSADDFDLLFIAELSNGQLASAALGVPYGAEARPLVEALCAGKPVFIKEDGVLFKKDSCASSELCKLYSEYLNRLWAFGAKPVSDADAGALRRAFEGDVPQCGEAAECSIFASRVLTEEAAKELAKSCGGQIRISQETIITPLAVDYITHEGIKTVRV